MIYEMLLKHEAPTFDDVQKSLLERLGVHAEPAVKDGDTRHLIRLLVDLLVGVNLFIRETSALLLILGNYPFLSSVIIKQLICSLNFTNFISLWSYAFCRLLAV